MRSAKARLVGLDHSKARHDINFESRDKLLTPNIMRYDFIISRIEKIVTNSVVNSERHEPSVSRGILCQNILFWTMSNVKFLFGTFIHSNKMLNWSIKERWTYLGAMILWILYKSWYTISTVIHGWWIVQTNRQWIHVFFTTHADKAMANRTPPPPVVRDLHLNKTDTTERHEWWTITWFGVLSRKEATCPRVGKYSHTCICLLSYSLPAGHL